MDPFQTIPKLRRLLSRVRFFRPVEWLKVRQLAAQVEPSQAATLLNSYMDILKNYPIQLSDYLTPFLLLPDQQGIPPLYVLCATSDPPFLLSWPKLLTQELLQGFCRTHDPSLLEYFLCLSEPEVDFWTRAWYVNYYLTDLDLSRPQDSTLALLLGTAPPPPDRVPSRPPGAPSLTRAESRPDPQQLVIKMLDMGARVDNWPALLTATLDGCNGNVVTQVIFERLDYFNHDLSSRRYLSMQILEKGNLELLVALFKREILLTPETARRCNLTHDSLNAIVLSQLQLDGGFYIPDPICQWMHRKELKRLRYRVYFEDSLLTRLLRMV